VVTVCNGRPMTPLLRGIRNELWCRDCGVADGIWTLKGKSVPEGTVPMTTIQMCKESFMFSSISFDILGRLRYSIGGGYEK
jgi:hypothetical protein